MCPPVGDQGTEQEHRHAGAGQQPGGASEQPNQDTDRRGQLGDADSQ
jgi:hypothetical protein